MKEGLSAGEEAMAKIVRSTWKGYESTPQMRKEILEGLAELWEKYPQQRLGQLLENYVFGRHTERGCIFHIYDETTLANIRKALEGK